jgi:AraC-like DNA-binding protein
VFVRLKLIADRIEMDQLSPLFARFAPSARVFHTGALCGAVAFPETDGIGHLHLLRSGTLRVHHTQGQMLHIAQPSVLFYPRALSHTLLADEDAKANLVCAEVEFGRNANNPLVRALPAHLAIPLDTAPELAPTAELLIAEASQQQCGRQAALDRLTEYFLILLLRHLLTSHALDIGMLAGLADARLAKALTGLHEQPELPWTLDEMARHAGMSRARFARHFHATVGSTPMDYLTDWRIGVAQTLLKRGKPLKVVAPEVGYTSLAALTRVFSKRVGLPPSAWLAASERAHIDD